MTETRPSSSDPDFDRLRLWLEARYAEIVQEIRGYPAPIPACDQHYNHLLARRRDYGQALRTLDQAQAAQSDPRAAIDALIDSLRQSVSFSDSELRALTDGVSR